MHNAIRAVPGHQTRIKVVTDGCTTVVHNDKKAQLKTKALPDQFMQPVMASPRVPLGDGPSASAPQLGPASKENV